MDTTVTSVQLKPLPAVVLELTMKAAGRSSHRSSSSKLQCNTLPDAYVNSALEDEVETLANTASGARNDVLNKAAFSLGQLVGGGALTRSDAEQALLSAAEANGLVRDDGELAVLATMRSGLEAGMQTPRGSKTIEKKTSALPEIRITPQVKEVVDAAEDALVANAPGHIYEKAGIVVRVIRHGRKVRGYKRVPDSPFITALPDGRLLELMSSSAKWKKFTVDGWEPALPPKWALQVLSARGRWAFPQIEAVTETPTLRPDGTVIDKEGYDNDTGTLYLPNGQFPSIPNEPTQEDAVNALAELFEPFAQFPYQTMADASVLVAGILTILARPAISGPTPLFVIRKNAPGVGGTLAADAISIIATGRVAPRMTLTSDAREMRKLILTLAIEGTPIVLFDNLEGRVGSPILAAAITSEMWADRLLGVSKVVRAPLRPVWFATGNGLGFSRDLGRRIALCDMFTEMEHPEDRDDFKHSDLLAYVAEQRSRLVTAALTLLRGYCVAHRPAHGQPRKGGFVGWDDLIRGALVWAKADDPLQTTKRVRAEADTDLEAIRIALGIWKRVFEGPVTAAAVVQRAKEHDPELLAALAELCDCPTEKLDSRRLGYALRKYRDRVVDGSRFTKPECDDDKVGLWTVEDL